LSGDPVGGPFKKLERLKIGGVDAATNGSLLLGVYQLPIEL